MGESFLRSTVWDRKGRCLIEFFHDERMMRSVPWNWDYFQDWGDPLYTRVDGRNGWFRWRRIG